MIDASDYSADGLIPFPALITGSTDVVNARFSRDVIISVTNNGTSNGTFVVEGNLDNSDVNWGNMDNDNEDTIIAPGITQLFSWDGVAPPFIRVRKVSGVESATVKMSLGMVV